MKLKSLLLALSLISIPFSGQIITNGGGGSGGGVVGGSCSPSFVTIINSGTGTPGCSSGDDGPAEIGNGLNFAHRLRISASNSNYGGFTNEALTVSLDEHVGPATLTSGWGTSPTIISAAILGSAGKVALGTTPSATTLVLDTGFSGFEAICTFQNETSGTLLKYSDATGTITITGTFVATNVISWRCSSVGST